MKSISKKSYKIHSHFNLTDTKQHEYITEDSKEELLEELIRFYEVMLMERKGWSNGEIELYMLIDDEKVITIEDETGKEKEEIEKLIHTLNTLTSWIEEYRTND